MTQTPGLLTFHTQTGRQNGGSGHILFLRTRIHLMMISENTVAKTKTPWSLTRAYDHDHRVNRTCEIPRGTDLLNTLLN